MNFLQILEKIRKNLRLLSSKIELKNSVENIIEVLKSGSNQNKIKILETIQNTNDLKILQEIISRLNDDSIQVRGEAFNALLLNKNEITKILIENLNSTNKNIKGFTSLVLANRNEKSAIPEIKKLVDSEHGMVRSCAIGSLGYLKAENITNIILKLLSDSNLEVQRSALYAAIQTKNFFPDQKFEEISKNSDSLIKNLLIKLKKLSGPKGI
tara:strand:- start:23 stop:658 length:636 start_codon:yes stop_codon:yes gene_type:complete